MRLPDLDIDALIPLLEPLEQAPRWRVAWSGGLDSTVLLHLLTVYRAHRRRAPPLLALHVNHQLQPAAADWAEHCARLGEELAVPLRRVAVAVTDSGSGLEADARHARYAALADGLAPGEVVLLAHHRDDQAETVLLRVLRGSGLVGLQGMPFRRALGRGSLARPLLAWPRSALESYARRHRLSWVEDPSNQDTRHDRNFLRRRVLPLLAERWPDSPAALTRAADHLREADRALEALLPEPVACRSRLGDPGLVLDALLAADDPVVLLQLRRWLRRLSLPLPDAAPLREFLRQLRGGGAHVRLQCGGRALQRYANGVFLLPQGQSVPEAPVRIAPADGVVALPAGRLQLRPAGASPGLQLAGGESLEVAWRRGGVRLQLPGRSGSRSLKKLLQAAGIPPWWRDQLPLLYLGEELLAVADLWLCDSSRYRPEGGEQCWRPAWETVNTEARTPGGRPPGPALSD